MTSEFVSVIVLVVTLGAGIGAANAMFDRHGEWDGWLRFMVGYCFAALALGVPVVLCHIVPAETVWLWSDNMTAFAILIPVFVCLGKLAKLEKNRYVWDIVTYLKLFWALITVLVVVFCTLFVYGYLWHEAIRLFVR
jgi:hypothetical protein